MTKRQIKRISKIYAAVVVSNLMGAGGDSDLMNAHERDLMHEELELIAARIIGKDSDCFRFGDLDQIIKLVISKPSTNG